MKPAINVSRFAMIYGIVITLFMLSTFGLALVGEFFEKGATALKEIKNGLFHWYDDPTAYFLAYIFGYILIWWKPLWGSLIIITASLLTSVINYDNPGFLIFALPSFIVGLLYLLEWYSMRKMGRG